MMPYDGAEAGRYPAWLALSRWGNGQSNEMHSLLVVLFVLAASQPPPIRGIVVDPAGSPLPGATVSIDSGDGFPVTTTADGRFEITTAAPGWRRLTITLPGFRSSDARTFVPAHGTASAAPEELRITLLPRALGETVSVTATRGSERLEGAAPVSVVTPADLQLAASPALDDVLRSVPGFSLFRRTSSRTANPTAQGASLRGVSASGASRALVLADGAPLNDPFGGWVYWDRVPQAAIERVEVVRGGASDLYGADALSGVVQVLTLRPRGPSASATIEAASHATPRASVFTGTAGRGWTASIAGEASRTDGTYVIAPEDRGSVDVRAGSDYLSGLAVVAIQPPSGWSLRVRGDGLGESRENGTPLQTNSTGVRQARFDLAVPVGGGQLETYGQLGDQVYRQAFSSIGASRNTETLTVRQRVPASQFGYGLTWRRLFRSIESARRGRDQGDRRHQRGDRVPSFGPRTGRSRTHGGFSAAAACSRRSARSWARGRRSWREHVATCGNASATGLRAPGFCHRACRSRTVSPTMSPFVRHSRRRSGRPL